MMTPAAGRKWLRLLRVVQASDLPAAVLRNSHNKEGPFQHGEQLGYVDLLPHFGVAAVHLLPLLPVGGLSLPALSTASNTSTKLSLQILSSAALYRKRMQLHAARSKILFQIAVSCQN